MKLNKFHFLYIPSIGCLIILLLSYLNFKRDYDVTLRNIENKKEQIRELEKKATLYYKELDSLKIHLQEVEVKLDGVQVEKIIIKEEYENKITLIDNMSFNELDEFFSDRLNK
jgi:galactokinase/mevalonate kinase-like predicted kinase